MADQVPVQFVPFASAIDSSFWADMARRKLSDWKLDSCARPLSAYYVNSDQPGVPCRLSVDFTALNSDREGQGVQPSCSAPIRAVLCRGQLLLTNTKEQMIEMDRKLMLQQAEATDLKKYHFTYWMCTPALVVPASITFNQSPHRIADEERDADWLNKWNRQIEQFMSDNQYPAAFFMKYANVASEFEFKTLDQLNNLDLEMYYLVFVDPSTFPEHPGWPLRNLLALLFLSRKSTSLNVRVLGLRVRTQSVTVGCDYTQSVVYCISMVPDATKSITCIGWEKNHAQKLTPRFLDMSESMDPKRLAENAVDLNLELMRWRLVPDIELDKMRNMKCLLFGAGTLGCNVARGLLAWGVRYISLVDNGQVSPSNPVRQSLFTYSDAVSDQRQYKAVAAAKALTQIHPGVNAQAHVLTVPMPGHSCDEKDVPALRHRLQELIGLVQSHDCVFLLMDSREGRWLPTLLAATMGKIAISCALGFDGYVIVRHGVRTANHQSILNVPDQSACSSSTVTNNLLSGEQLGCYFCSDVTAPGNSTHDRTIDQQCTVTRPGVSQIAAGLAVELLSSLSQHEMGAQAPAMLPATNQQTTLLEDTSDTAGTASSCLGVVPHQIRGYVSQFTQMCLAVQRFDRCTACSPYVIDRYNSEGVSFLVQACNEPGLLETVTGLDTLQQTANEIELWEYDDSDSVKSMDV